MCASSVSQAWWKQDVCIQLEDKHSKVSTCTRNLVSEYSFCRISVPSCQTWCKQMNVYFLNVKYKRYSESKVLWVIKTYMRKYYNTNCRSVLKLSRQQNSMKFSLAVCPRKFHSRSLVQLTYDFSSSPEHIDACIPSWHELQIPRC
jgi:hypothetical protein